MVGRAGAKGVYGYISNARSRSRVVVVALVLAAGLLLPQPVLAGSAVTRWMDLALRAVAAQNVATPNAGRLYAMVTVAMYDAINGINIANTAGRRGREHALVPPLGAPVGGARDVAAAAAAYTVLVNFELSAARKAELDAALDADITAAGGLDTPRVVDGKDWGMSVGQQVVSQRATDGTQSAENDPRWLQVRGASRKLGRALAQHDDVRRRRSDTVPRIAGAPGPHRLRVHRGVQ